MSNIIKLLPDSVANQIAAGEVIQRPASVVKELLENSIDAGATQITLIIKDGGKTLIQITDNGYGMSETDARMCFERHSTSKIDNASDLFRIKTMGFRGEALASIASISRVELKSRLKNAELGTEVIVEGSVAESQHPCQCPAGTTVAVKNLFYNTPARRNFLKSENIEKSHIFNEFARVAMATPKTGFKYYYNNKLTLQVDPSNLKQRISGLFGTTYNQRLIPVEENTDIISVSGFVLKPEFARKRRSEQFFFVNKRYVKAPYLNHSVENAFSELIPDGMHPSFFLFLETDPSNIDINVHPTKTEIKFQNEAFIYKILLSSVKRALGRFNISPSLDFERETAFDDVIFDKDRPVSMPTIKVDPDYNPFKTDKSASRLMSERKNPQQWEKLCNDMKEAEKTDDEGQGKDHNIFNKNFYDECSRDINTSLAQKEKRFWQLNDRYIITPVKSGLMFIDQQRAHERILYEKFLKKYENKKTTVQQLLYPLKAEFIESDANIMREIIPHINALGFDISEFGGNTFVINSIPAEIKESENIVQIIEELLENYKKNLSEPKLDIYKNIARSLAKSEAIKHGRVLTEKEMNTLVGELFACSMPGVSPASKPALFILTYQELSDRFK